MRSRADHISVSSGRIRLMVSKRVVEEGTMLMPGAALSAARRAVGRAAWWATCLASVRGEEHLAPRGSVGGLDNACVGSTCGRRRCRRTEPDWFCYPRSGSGFWPGVGAGCLVGPGTPPVGFSTWADGRGKAG